MLVCASLPCCIHRESEFAQDGDAARDQSSALFVQCVVTCCWISVLLGVIGRQSRQDVRVLLLELEVKIIEVSPR